MATTPTPEQIEALLNGPALTPPPGVQPDFDNPPNNNAAGYGVLSVMLIIGTIAIVFRTIARLKKSNGFRLEDSLDIASFILFAAYLGCAYQVLYFPGFYVHQWNVRVRDMSRILYPFNIASNCYNGMIGALKAAILLEWLQIFSPTGHRNAFFWTCHIILWVNILFYSASFFAINLACIPRQRIWDKTITAGHCFNENDLYLAGTIINLISDVAILIAPQRVIWSLKLSRNKKIGVSLIFAIGVLTCGIAAARIYTTVNGPKNPDAIYNLPTLVFLGTAEMLCGLLVLCVPAFPQVISILGIPKFISQVSLLLSTRRSSPSQSYGRDGTPWQQSDSGRTRFKTDRQSEEHSLKPLGRSPNASGRGEELGIRRTTEFTSGETHTGDEASINGFDPRPWTQNGR